MSHRTITQLPFLEVSCQPECDDRHPEEAVVDLQVSDGCDGEVSQSVKVLLTHAARGIQDKGDVPCGVAGHCNVCKNTCQLYACTVKKNLSLDT